MKEATGAIIFYLFLFEKYSAKMGGISSIRFKLLTSKIVEVSFQKFDDSDHRA
jgi:hypothetical protein